MRRWRHRKKKQKKRLTRLFGCFITETILISWFDAMSRGVWHKILRGSVYIKGISNTFSARNARKSNLR